MNLPPFGWDKELFMWANGFGGPLMDYFCAWPTYLADPVILILLTTSFMLIWDEGRITRKLLGVSLGTLGGYLAAHAVKLLVFRERPYAHFRHEIEAGTQSIHALFELLLKESSFPSAHTATAFACAAALNVLYGRKLWTFYILAAFIGFTRLYVGVHFPSDILVGAALGLAAGTAVARLIRPDRIAKQEAV